MVRKLQHGKTVKLLLKPQFEEPLGLFEKAQCLVLKIICTRYVGADCRENS